jgi:hypothetical protein
MNRAQGLLQKRCQYCKKVLEGSGQLSRHVAHSEYCRQQWETELGKLPQLRAPQKELNDKVKQIDGFELEEVAVEIDQDDYVLPAPYTSEGEIEVQAEWPVRRSVDIVSENEDNPVDDAYHYTRWTEEYPGRVAEASGTAKTRFDEWQEEQMFTGVSKWSPFTNEEEWELAQWLLKNVGQSAIDDYLKLPSVSVSNCMNGHH